MSHDDPAPVPSERAGVTIEVDRALCFGFGDCVDSAPGLFELDTEGRAYVVDPESHDLDDLLAAAQNCPVDAILVVDAASGLQQHP